MDSQNGTTVANMGLDKHALLPMTQFSFWYNAIIRNNETLVKETLFGASVKERFRLLNGRFVDDTKNGKETSMTNIWSKNKHHNFFKMEVNRPWHLAAVYRSTDVLTVLYSEGAQVNQLNFEGGNIINCLIAVCVLERSFEERMTGIYHFLEKLLTKDELKELLFHKSTGDLNCLEQCATMRVLHLFTAILNTSDVYIFRRQSCDMYEDLWLDVTKYESPESSLKNRVSSPLNLLGNIEKEFIPKPHVKACFADPLMRNWIDVKLRNEYFYVVMGGASGCISIILYALILMYGSELLDIGDANFAYSKMSTCNGSSIGTIRNIDLAVTLIYINLIWHVSMILDFLIFSFLVIRWIFVCPEPHEKEYISLFRSVSRRATNVVLYKVTQIFCCVLVIIFCSCLLINYHSETAVISRGYLEALNSIIITLKSFSVLYYGQILLHMKHLSFSVFMMIYDMLNFAFLWLLLSIPFAFCFAVIMTRYHLNLCHEGFDGLFQIMYTNFRILLNLESLDYGFGNITGLAVTHIMFVAVNAFLFLNLMIAVFSDSFSFVSSNAETLRTVQKLSFALSYSDTFVTSLLKFCIKRKYKQFIYEGKNVYLHVRVLPKLQLD